jgi:hypothetical protein
MSLRAHNHTLLSHPRLAHYTPGTGFSFRPSYVSQGYGGGTLTCFHTSPSRTNWLNTMVYQIEITTSILLFLPFRHSAVMSQHSSFYIWVYVVVIFYMLGLSGQISSYAS